MYVDNFFSWNSLSVEFNRNIVGMEQLKKLNKLSLWNYKPKSKNLSEISELKAVQELEIIKSSINSLKGSGNLLNLERLKLGYLNQLSYIDELERIRERLKALNFESCKKIVNHEYVACLNNLEELSFNECGNIETINFIDKMPNLKRFIFMGTNIIDGNLQFCERLEYVAFTNKKHFSHKKFWFSVLCLWCLVKKLMLQNSWQSDREQEKIENRIFYAESSTTRRRAVLFKGEIL